MKINNFPVKYNKLHVSAETHRDIQTWPSSQDAGWAYFPSVMSCAVRGSGPLAPGWP